MSKRKREYDPNIAKALQEIKWPILNHEGKEVYVRRCSRHENGFEHIAGKNHYLKVRDIKQIPEIIKKPYQILDCQKMRKGISYFGIRKGINKSKYLKIVVRERMDGTQEIVTVYPNKVIK